MARVVRSVAGFRKELNAGDVFWHMTSDFHAPCEIVGPCTITVFWMERQFGFQMVEYTLLNEDGEVIEERSIGDLTNKYHGVFLSAADAYEYFEVQRNKYAQDPYLIAEVVQGRIVGGCMFGWSALVLSATA